MRRLLIQLLLCAFAVLLAGIAVTDSSQPNYKDIAIESELLDLHCYVKGQRGASHKRCGEHCALNSYPVGLEGKANEVYTLIASAKLLASHVGNKVRVTGKAFGHLIKPTKVEVRVDDRWKEVEFEEEWAKDQPEG